MVGRYLPRLVSLLTLTSTACGGEAEGGQTLADLSEAELVAQCGEWQAQATSDPQVVEGLCRIRAAARALLDPQRAGMDAVASCTMDTASCLASPPIDFCPGSLKPDCAATVDELSDCVDTQTAKWREAKSRTCEEQLQLTEASLRASPMGAGNSPAVQACSDLESSCFLPSFKFSMAGSAAQP